MFKALASTLFKKEKGFTLVELMVVMTIISIMTAVLLANYRAGGQQLALDRSANKLAQDIRRAQEMVMSAAVCEPCGGIVPPGYGIIIDRQDIWKTSYRIYADNGTVAEVFDAGDTIIGDPIDLENGVYVEEIRKEPPPNPNLHWGSINFRPPDPAENIFLCVPINNPCLPGPAYPGEPWIYIILALETNPSKTKTVKVNNAGLIYVE